jgi:hypothetical protein
LDKSVLALPNAPVREIAGKYSALAAPIVLGSDQLLLSLQQVRPALQQLRGQTGRHLR